MALRRRVKADLVSWVSKGIGGSSTSRFTLSGAPGGAENLRPVDPQIDDGISFDLHSFFPMKFPVHPGQAGSRPSLSISCHCSSVSRSDMGCLNS